MEVIKVDPRECTKWKYADRSFFEYGDPNILAEDIKRNGQIEPVYVRCLDNDKDFKYEVIAGNRRFQACLSANIQMKAIICDVSDYEASVIQFKENEKKMKEDWKVQAAEMLENARCKNLNIYDSNAPIGKGIHEMGTARMGHDPKTSILNKHNQIHSVPNVYMTDGAFMTSSGTQNPSLTYMAFTARAVNHAVGELKKMNL